MLQREIELMRQENERLRRATTLTYETDRTQLPSVNIKIVSKLLSEYNGAGQDFQTWDRSCNCLGNLMILWIT